MAVTSSLQPVFEELLAVYRLENTKNYQLFELVHASSGNLASQIAHGASYIIFFSAEDSYCEFVQRKLQLRQQSTAFAKGTLVRISNKKLLQENKWDQSEHIAIANPKVAPYGKLAEAYLKEQTNYEHIKHKVVYGQNVNQVLQYMLTKNVEVSFLAKGMVSSSKIDTTEFDITDVYTNTIQDIIHTYIILKPSKELEDFLEFLKTPKAKAVLNNYGYVPL